MLEILDRYSTFFLVGSGFLIGVPIIWNQRDKAGFHGKWQVGLLCLIYSVCSVLGAMLLAKLEGALTGESGGKISTYGVYFFGTVLLLAGCLLFRLNTKGIFDLFALYVLPSLFLQRCNCLRTGCCGGTAIFGTKLHWPTRETELIFYITMFGVLWKRIKRNEIPGQLFPLLMICYGSFRFINEWFRRGNTIGLHLAHVWSGLCIVIGCSIYYELRTRAKKSNVRQRRT